MITKTPVTAELSQQHEGCCFYLEKENAAQAQTVLEASVTQHNPHVHAMARNILERLVEQGRIEIFQTYDALVHPSATRPETPDDFAEAIDLLQSMLYKQHRIMTNTPHDQTAPFSRLVA